MLSAGYWRSLVCKIKNWTTYVGRKLQFPVQVGRAVRAQDVDLAALLEQVESGLTSRRAPSEGVRHQTKKLVPVILEHLLDLVLSLFPGRHDGEPAQASQPPHFVSKVLRGLGTVAARVRSVTDRSCTCAAKY